MMKKVIYPSEGGIAVLTPFIELAIEELARRDVPDGLPFLIVDEEDLPGDDVPTDAWDADFSEPDGFGIGPFKWTLEIAQEGLAKAEAMQPPAMPELLKIEAYSHFSWPKEKPVRERKAEYAAYVDQVNIANQRTRIKHESAVALWAADRDAVIAKCRALIEQATEALRNSEVVEQ